MKVSSQSLAKQALLALLLTIGFYSLAIVMILLLIFIPYAMMQYMDVICGQAILLCGAGALAIAWSILPRIDRFHPPGLLLDPNTYPELFAHIEDIAQKTNQEMPNEVYLVPEFNAYVAERGGIMGIGTKRVMGIGLPLLPYLTISQLRAILAHEFGHYHSQDTKASIWVYKIRSTIVRTVSQLGTPWLQAPFVAYAKMFLRITTAVSRNQEFVADDLAAQKIGANHLIESLQILQKLAPLYRVYWSHECLYILEDGYHPPLAEGFAQFIEAPKIKKAFEQTLLEMSQKENAGLYDSHPPFLERIQILELSTYPSEPINETLAITFFEQQETIQLEAQILSTSSHKNASELNKIAWEDVFETIVFHYWKQEIKHFSEFLADITLDTLPEFVRSPYKLRIHLREATNNQMTEDSIEAFTNGLVGKLLYLFLFKQGGTPENYTPGQEPTIYINDTVVTPFQLPIDIKERHALPPVWDDVYTSFDLHNQPILAYLEEDNWMNDSLPKLS